MRALAAHKRDHRGLGVAKGDGDDQIGVAEHFATETGAVVIARRVDGQSERRIGARIRSSEPSAGDLLLAGLLLGDESNQASSSKCGAEVLTVTPAPKPTTLTTSLSGERQSGEKISVDELGSVTDHATLSGENAAEAKGTVTYHVYLDPGCKDLSAALAPVNVSEGSVPESEPVERSSGIYYWQAEYSGDEHNEKSISKCGAEVVTVRAPTTLTTSLSGGGQSGQKHHRARRDPRHRSGDVEAFPPPPSGFRRALLNTRCMPIRNARTSLPWLVRVMC